MDKHSSEIATRRAMNTPVHSSHGDGQSCNTGRRLAKLLNDQAGRLGRTARLSMDNPTRRKALKLLASANGGVTYDDLFDALSVSDRWIREIVADLRRDGVVKTPGNPAIIHFATDGIAIAVRELLSFLSTAWANAVVEGDKAASGLSTALDAAAGVDVEKYLQSMSSMLRGGGG